MFVRHFFVNSNGPILACDQLRATSFSLNYKTLQECPGSKELSDINYHPKYIRKVLTKDVSEFKLLFVLRVGYSTFDVFSLVGKVTGLGSRIPDSFVGYLNKIKP